MRIGIFGGSFNPPHAGHVNSLSTVSKKAGLDKVIVIPTSQNPLKIAIDGPTSEQRLELTKKAIDPLGDKFEVSDIELKRGGSSYTIDTLKDLKKKYADDELFLIIGMDQFEQFSEWKSAKKILETANLIVTSRPGFHFPDNVDEFPQVISSEIAEHDFNFVELKTGKNIQFIKLEDVEISSSQLRKWLRSAKNVSKYMPLAVEAHIRDANLYPASREKIKNYGEFTEFCSQVLLSKKAVNLKALDLRAISAPSEFTIIASGTSTRHAAGLGENLLKAVKEEFNLLPLSVEGVDEGRWVVVDFGGLIVHLFYDFIRQDYALETLWKEAKEIKIVERNLN